MTHKLILKLAGYEVKRDRYRHDRGISAYQWVKRVGDNVVMISPFYHISELHSWRNAWKHYKKGLDHGH